MDDFFAPVGFRSIRVELPSHSHAFTITVAENITIATVKEAIKLQCVGKPREEGQRLIYRGRVLDDKEVVRKVWEDQPQNTSCVVHLSVHPSAWTTVPPNTQEAAPLTPTTPQFHDYPAANSPMATAPLYSSYSDAAYAFDYFSNAHVRAARAATPAAAVTPMPTATSSPMMYILFRHNNALLAMMQSPLEPDVAEHVGPARRQAETTLKQLGWAWPQLLDQPYPDDVPGEAGAKYERSFVNGQEYLTLTTPNATPTARQRHALAVLGYTFPLLSLTIPNLNAVSNIRPSQGNHHDLHPGVLPHLNNHLRQIGMGPIVRPRFHMRDMLVFRPILLPLFMLSLRAMILLYIFSPSRKPFFALMIGLWVLYEVWKAIAALAPQPGQQAPAINGVLARNVAAPNNPARAPAAPVRPGNPARTPGTNHPRPADAALESVSKLNFDVEERALQARPEDEAAESINAPPTTAHKIKSFVALFATTLHPAVWDRRRAVLSRREGQIRTESNARERQDDAAAEDTNLREDERRRKQEEEQKRRESREALVNQHARRPRWVKDYIERVRINEWED